MDNGRESSCKASGRSADHGSRSDQDGSGAVAGSIANVEPMAKAERGATDRSERMKWKCYSSWQNQLINVESSWVQVKQSKTEMRGEMDRLDPRSQFLKRDLVKQ